MKRSGSFPLGGSLFAALLPAAMLACGGSEPSNEGGSAIGASSTTQVTSSSGVSTSGATATSGAGTATSGTTGAQTTGTQTATAGTTSGTTSGTNATTDGSTSTATGGGSSTGDVSTDGTSSTSAGGASSTSSEATNTATTSVQVECSGSIVSTGTRPQLSSDDAADYTVRSYLAAAGAVGSVSTDNWDPTAGVGDPAGFTPTFTVAGDGSGTHSTVQAAIDSASGSTRQYVLVKSGTYRETVTIPSSAPPITLYGLSSDPSDVVIVDGKSADSAGGTSASATLTAKSAGFQALNLTLSNDFATPSSGSGLQAVALHTQGDQTVLENVTLHGFQDTLYLDTPSDATVARIYILRSFIEGDTDFIFGRATAVIQDSTIHYLSSRKGTSSGIHLAPSTHVDHDFGFLLIGCEFTADSAAPADKIYLGRSWDSSSTTPTPNGQAVVRESVLGAHIRLDDPWAAAATSGREYSATGNRFEEYCNGGPGAG